MAGAVMVTHPSFIFGEQTLSVLGIGLSAIQGVFCAAKIVAIQGLRAHILLMSSQAHASQPARLCAFGSW